MKFKHFIEEFGERASDLIARYETFKDLEGEQKKEKVDEALLKWALNALETVPLNVFFKFVIKFILKNYLDDLTQVIFNLIETRIAGITK